MQPQKISRRQFVKTSAIVVGDSIVTCSGLAAAGLYTPPVVFPTAIGQGKMDQKILVAYASWCGSTAEIAREVASILTARGETVDLIQAGDVKDLSAYKAVVLGSAIRRGKWKPEASDFVARFQAELALKSSAFFTVCLTLKDDTEENRKKVSAYLDPVRALVQPGREGFFAGRIDYQRLSFLDGFLMRNMIKAPEGDFRKWDQIRAWAGEGMPA
jgi:menaquinone-dependent protoporphyrinogen oxidase